MRRSLSKKEIVKSKSDINRIFRSGASKGAPGLKILCALNGLELSRIAVIPVHGYGNSVQRNRIRRRIKEVFRLEKDKLKKGFDFAFVVYPGKIFDFGTLTQQIQSLLSKLDAYI